MAERPSSVNEDHSSPGLFVDPFDRLTRGIEFVLLERLKGGLVSDGRAAELDQDELASLCPQLVRTCLPYRSSTCGEQTLRLRIQLVRGRLIELN